MKACLAVLLVSFSLQVYAGWFGPDTYEECIERRVMSAKTETAAKLAKGFCIKEERARKEAMSYMDMGVLPHTLGGNLKWNDLTATEYFKSLSADSQEKVRVGFFHKVVMPTIKDKARYEGLRAAWDRRTLKKSALAMGYAEGVNQTIRGLITITLGFIIAYLICTKWHGKFVAIAAFILAFLVAWPVGGLLFLQFFVTERFTEAALAVFTRGIWGAIAGAGVGVWLGWRRKKRSLASS